MDGEDRWRNFFNAAGNFEMEDAEVVGDPGPWAETLMSMLVVTPVAWCCRFNGSTSGCGLALALVVETLLVQCRHYPFGWCGRHISLGDLQGDGAPGTWIRLWVSLGHGG